MADQAITISLQGDREVIDELRRELGGIPDTKMRSGTIEQWDGEAQQLVSLAAQIAPIAIPAAAAIFTTIIKRRRSGEIRGLSVNGKSIKATEIDLESLAKLMREMNRSSSPG